MEPTPKRAWHTLEPEAVLEVYSSRSEGLTEAERTELRATYGRNELPVSKPDSLLVIFLKQFRSPLIYLLMVAAGLVLAVGEWVDAAIIAFVLLFNAVAGTIQAGRAQNTMRALQKITKTNATIITGGERQVVTDIEVVPGDIIFLAEGDKVPADARLLTAHNLRVNESALTGEPDPASKNVETLDNPELTSVDQKNMVFKGTLVVAGNATAMVTATGLNTMIGGISQQITGIDTEIPLQKNVRKLSHAVIVVVVVLSLFIFALGSYTGNELEAMFSLAVAVIVSAVPEGLPIVMTLLLASGVWRMGKRNVLVKRLQAVEALGETQIIAVDKTGTITKNELALTQVLAGSEMYEVEASGYDPDGRVLKDGNPIELNVHSDVVRVATVAGLCADARVEYDDEAELWDVQGDPTEGAMAVFARKVGCDPDTLRKEYEPIDEVPFDAARKYHAVLHRIDGDNYLTVAGAPEAVLKLATNVYENGEVVPLTPEKQKDLLATVADLSSQALRVIAVAERTAPLSSAEPESVQDLTIVGLLGMQDSLRAEVPEAMERTREAGIRVVMITGDHQATATAIAQAAGIYHEGDTVITNDDIDKMTTEELARAIEHATVFARITPEHKLSIVQAYQARGDIIAMTGDGVNDALSLVAADLGVAMGRRGTEVAKEAADLVLLDDNFGSIVSAVEEGRGVYVNMQKVILYLFSTSLGEVLVILMAIILFLPMPVLAAQLIWINLVTDGFLDVGLAMEPKEKGLLKRRFTKSSTSLLDRWMIERLVLKSTVMAVGTIAVFLWYLPQDFGLAMTAAVTTLVVSQWFKVWTNRSQYDSIFSIDPFSNRYLLWATGLVVIFHIVALYTPFMQQLLTLQAIGWQEWLLAILVATAVVAVDELRKLLYRLYEDPLRDGAPNVPPAV